MSTERVLKASHGINLRVDVWTEIDPQIALPHGHFVELVCVGVGQTFAIASWPVNRIEAELLASNPKQLAAFMVRKIGDGLR